MLEVGPTQWVVAGGSGVSPGRAPGRSDEVDLQPGLPCGACQPDRAGESLLSLGPAALCWLRSSRLASTRGGQKLGLERPVLFCPLSKCLALLLTAFGPTR